MQITENTNKEQQNEQQQQDVNNQQEQQTEQNLTLSSNQQEVKIQTIKLKVVVAGSVAVGKTSLLNRIQYGELLVTKSTSGAQFQKIILQNDNITLQLNIFDTAGSEQFRSLAPMYFRKLNILILVFDASRPETIEDCIYYYEMCKHSQQETQWKCILVANKSDLVQDQQQIQDCIKQAQEKIDCETCTVSCKTGQGFEQLLDLIQTQGIITAQSMPDEQQGESYLEIKKSNKTYQDKCC